MEKFANAVKALIVHKDKLLILRNSLADKFRPGEPDFPGGRLELGESPYFGLRREVKEELGIDMADSLFIDVPVSVSHFTRPDGQTVTMMSFYCWLTKNDIDVVLSDEHHTYEWVDIFSAGKELFGQHADVMLKAYDNLMKIYLSVCK